MDIRQSISESIKGSTRAQRRIFDAYSGRMMKLCGRYLRDALEAEDAFIKAFNKVFLKLESFEYRGEESLSRWISTIMVNECLMTLRQRRHLEKIEDLGDHQMPSTDENYSDEEFIYQLILDLPMGYRTVFNLNVIEGYSHKEIAGMLDISEGTSKSQLSKARKLLQDQINANNMNYGT